MIPTEMLLLAYRSGIFPMADSREDPEIFWVEPRERATFPLENFRMSKSLRKTVRQDRFRVSCDTAFADVVGACAQPRPDHPESWISHRIAASYAALHDQGHAHSIECWDGETLVGGLYGVSFDRVFCGESMFSHANNASKVALAWLVAILRRAGFEVLDCQFMTDHLASLGAIEMSQQDYVQKIASAQGKPRMSIPEAYVSLVSGADGAGSAGAAAGADAVGVGAGASSPGNLIAQSLTQTS
ncbi:leucyl/phenylalanyl-tRNA--protein transferase [Altererythrobacter aquaemixtae]|uniref:Leucyl/phenylalanyl-tRNA--protein transferase n=1 Tax=Pontixanthobacter aquaemixtae TaxID=1958940 RepID=A0A844ZN83_9SPHN|nr:leucyl/phenylalanyl-tRNA--protein transferase [Pontixanthobacter aquaemixtae]